MPHTTVGSAGQDGFLHDELRAVLRQITRHGMFEPHDHGGVRVTGSEVMALGELAAGPRSQQDLGAALGLEKSTVSRLVAGMQGRGWLDRTRDPANRRFYRVGLSAEGERVADLVGGDLERHHQELMAALTPDEREALRIGLRALARVLQDPRQQE